MFTWGYPEHGRLGHSFAAGAVEAEGAAQARCCWRPRRLELVAGARIRNLTLGNDHTILLDDHGRLYRCARSAIAAARRPEWPGSVTASLDDQGT